MKSKMNFRSSVEVEKFLYRVSQDLINGKLNAAAGAAAARIAGQWLAAHQQRQENEILRRLSGLENAMKTKQREVRK